MLEILRQTDAPLVERPAWALTPRASEVLVVDDRLAEMDIADLAPGTPVWPQLARQLDAVHMTATGALAFWRTPRRSEPRYTARLRLLAAMTEAKMGSPLDMWEAESTIWFRWRFTSETPLGRLTVPHFGGGRRRDTA